MNIKNIIQANIDLKKDLLGDAHALEKIQQIIDLSVNSLKADGRIFWCGNGGSAADAQHLSSELSGRFYKNRAPLNSEALHVNSSYLTAVANDFGFDEIYSRALLAKGKKGDTIICMTTSGKSPNILKVILQAQKMGIHVVALTGKFGIANNIRTKIQLDIPSEDTPRIQEAHMLIGHIICQGIEEILFK